MSYEILGKKIVSFGGAGSDELIISFDDGVTLTLKAEAYVNLDTDGWLRVRPRIQISTDKVELTAEEED